MSFTKKLIYLFIKPADLFRHTKENRDWVIPLCLLIAFAFAASYIIVVNLIIPGQIDKFSSMPGLTEEEMNINISYLNSSYHMVSTFLSTAFTKIFYYPVLAFLITMIPMIFGGKAKRFVYVFSAVAYTGIINGIGFLMDSIIKLNYGTMDIGFNLSLLFHSSNPFLNSFLKNIYFFDFWQIILLTLLVSIYFNYSKVKSFIIIFNSWLSLKLLAAYFYYLKATFK